MNICYVLPHFYPHVGGSEQAFMDLIVDLKKRKQVNVRVITSASGNKVGVHTHNGVTIYSYDWKLFFGHPIVKKNDLVEHIKWADVVHVGVYSPVIPTLKLCKALQKPSIVTVHEVLGNKWYLIEANKIKATLFKLYEKINVMVKADYFHTPSVASANDLLNTNKKAKVKTIYWISENKYNILEKDYRSYYEFLNVDKSDKVFLNYGRPGKTKGIFVYLDAIDKVVKTLPKEKMKNVKFCFLMAEDPQAEKQKFLKLVEKNQLEQNVIVKSSVSRKDLNNYILCADFIVVPSITEGFGLTAIEACERQKRIIHSSGGSLPEVTFGHTLQFENRNSDDLAKCLMDVINGKNVFKNKKKKDFSSEKVCNEFYNLYRKVLSDNNER